MSNPSLRVEPLTGRVGPRRVSDKLMALIMAGLLFTVGAVSLARLNQQGISTAPLTGEVIAQRQLDFQDIGGGRIQISDAQTGESITLLPRGEGSFVRGVVRSLVRSRNLARSPARSPFLLTRYDDGRLILTDPVTGQGIELQAFGPTNAGNFEAMLPGYHRDSLAELR